MEGERREDGGKERGREKDTYITCTIEYIHTIHVIYMCAIHMIFHVFELQRLRRDKETASIRLNISLIYTSK